MQTLTGYIWKLITRWHANDVTSVPFLLQIWQDVCNPQLFLSMAQDHVRYSDTIYESGGLNFYKKGTSDTY